MAIKYFRNVNGNWSVDANWSTTSGGGSDTVKPTNADDVRLDSNSGNCTIDAASVCRSLNCTTGTGDYASTLTHNAFTISLGDATAGDGNVAIKFSAAMTYSPQNTTTSIIQMNSSSATVQDIDFAGKSIYSFITATSASGSYRLTGAVSQPTGASVPTFSLSGQTFDFNAQTVSLNYLIFNGTTARTIILGSGTITCVTCDATTDTNLSLFSTGNTLVCTGNGSAVFKSGTKTWNNVTLSSDGAFVNIQGTGTIAGTLTFLGKNTIITTTTSYHTISNAMTINNLTFDMSAQAVKYCGLSIVSGITLTGTLKLYGNSAVNRVFLTGGRNALPSTVTNTGATMDWEAVDVNAITFTSPVNAASIPYGCGDAGYNTNLTATPAVTQTWVGTGSDNWSTNAWTTRVPLPQDDVVIASAFSPATRIITVDMPRMGKNIDCSGVTGNPQINLGSSSVANDMIVCGNFILSSGITIGNQNMSFRLFSVNQNSVLTASGVNIWNPLTLECHGRTVTLGSALFLSRGFTQTSGSFDTGNFSVSSATYVQNTSFTRTFTMGTSTWSLTSSSGAALNMGSSTNLTFNVLNGTFVINGSGTGARTLAGNGYAFGNVIIATDNVTISGANSFKVLSANTAGLTNGLKFTNGVTQTVQGFRCNGTAGNLAKIVSSTPGSAYTITKTGGVVGTDYISITDCTITGTGIWYAGANSTDVSGNSVASPTTLQGGWIFRRQPRASGMPRIKVARTL